MLSILEWSTKIKEKRAKDITTQRRIPTRLAPTPATIQTLWITICSSITLNWKKYPFMFNLNYFISNIQMVCDNLNLTHRKILGIGGILTNIVDLSPQISHLRKIIGIPITNGDGVTLSLGFTSVYSQTSYWGNQICLHWKLSPEQKWTQKWSKMRFPPNHLTRIFGPTLSLIITSFNVSIALSYQFCNKTILLPFAAPFALIESVVLKPETWGLCRATNALRGCNALQRCHSRYHHHDQKDCHIRNMHAILRWASCYGGTWAHTRPL